MDRLARGARWALWLLGVVGIVTGCGGSDAGLFGPTGTDAGTDTSAQDTAPGDDAAGHETAPLSDAVLDEGPIPGDASPDTGDDAAAPVVGHLTGTVFAPEGTIPISGALVYLSPDAPGAFADGTFCDVCAQPPAGTASVTSSPDGTFDLPVSQTGQFYLVVQKGLFRRVRPIVVQTGSQGTPVEATTLPSKLDNANGDEIPRIAIVEGAWDYADVLLGKLGLAALSPGSLGKHKVDYATASFDYYKRNTPPKPNDPTDATVFLKDSLALSKYNLLFLPSDGDTSSQPWCSTSLATDPTIQGNVQQFVAGGGKLFVSDFSYEFVRQLFPGYAQWVGETSTTGSACQQAAYDVAAQVQDQGLQSWLAATGITTWSAQGNWSQIDYVDPVDTTDKDGLPIKVTPKVWVQGKGPHLLSFDRGCGRVEYNTFITEPDDSGENLTPQARAMLYAMFELGGCM